MPLPHQSLRETQTSVLDARLGLQQTNSATSASVACLHAPLYRWLLPNENNARIASLPASLPESQSY